MVVCVVEDECEFDRSEVVAVDDDGGSFCDARLARYLSPDDLRVVCVCARDDYSSIIPTCRDSLFLHNSSHHLSDTNLLFIYYYYYYYKE